MIACQLLSYDISITQHIKIIQTAFLILLHITTRGEISNATTQYNPKCKPVNKNSVI